MSKINANDKYRKCANVKDEAYIHDCQFETGKKVIDALMRMQTRRGHTILVAPMQSGKTGICNGIVNIINVDKLYSKMGINKYFFVSGMNDTGLKRQTVGRVFSQIIDATPENTYVNKKQSEKNTCNKYFVMKNSDLLKYEGTIDNSIIFIDEAHYGSNDKNILSQFLYNFDIDWKDRNTLIERNIYIVSISATPFDEIISDTASVKEIIVHQPDENYVGVSKYIDNGLVYNGEFDSDKAGSIIHCLAESVDRMNDDDVSGVCFVRTSDFEELTTDEWVLAHFDIFEMVSNGSKLEYLKLNQMIHDLIDANKRYKSISKGHFFSSRISKPMPLLVLIKGAYRAGITLETSFKDYIYMVYDYSVKAATTAQALLGRMCGYRKEDVELKTRFYINTKMANQYGKWTANDFDRETVPCDRFKTISLPIDSEKVEGSTYGSRSCGNFDIPMTTEEIIDFYRKVKNKSTRNKMVESEIKKVFERHNIDIHYDYVIENAVSGKNHYAQSSQTKRFDSFSPTSLVYQFRPKKIQKFMSDTGRTELEYEDVGKRGISIVLDAEIYNNGQVIGGNKRMLIYYVEVVQKISVQDQSCMYKEHKDTSLLD